MEIKKNLSETISVFKGILGSEEIKEISKSTGYTDNYVRQIIHGYKPPTNRSMIIIDVAIEITNKKINQLQKKLK